jgi:hypothetical protein
MFDDLGITDVVLAQVGLEDRPLDADWTSWRSGWRR